MSSTQNLMPVLVLLHSTILLFAFVSIPSLFHAKVSEQWQQNADEIKFPTYFARYCIISKKTASKSTPNIEKWLAYGFNTHIVDIKHRFKSVHGQISGVVVFS